VGNYFGVTVVALATVAVVVLWRDRRVWALAAVAVTAIIIGLAGSTPLGAVVYHGLPGARLFRCWGRTLVLANLAVAMLAGVGVREALRSPMRALRVVVLAAAVLAGCAVALPHIGALDGMRASGLAGALSRLGPVMLILCLVVAVAVASRYRRAGMLAIVVVAASDLVTFASAGPWRAESIGPAAARAFYDETRPAPFGSPYDAPGGIDRWASDWYGFRDVSLVKDLYGVNGYDPMVQRDWAATAGGWAYDGYPTRSDLWQPGWTADVLRVTTLVLNNDIAPTGPGWRRDGAVAGLDFTRWVRTPDLPEAYLVSSVGVAPLDEIGARLRDPRTAMRTTAYVEHLPRELDGGDGAGPAGAVPSSDVLGSGRIVVDAERDALLVLAHSWQPGWHAMVDGSAAPVVRTNGLVIGVPVPQGRHVVRVTFTPPGLRTGMMLMLIALVALFFGAPLARAARGLRGRATHVDVTQT
jgi:hypothetical protein